MTIFFDIETLPSDTLDVIEDLARSITAPATHKKQEAIDKWMEENKAQALKDAISKTSFDGMYGRVACIAWAADDGEIRSTMQDDSERDAIERFYEYLSFDCQNNSFCGHNIHGFDLPFLKHRSIILGIKPPSNLLATMNGKPWDYHTQDTMLMWSPDKQKRVSMDRLCKVLNIESDDEIDGSMVAETWKTDPDKVIYHCIEDVRKVRQIYKRLTFNR